MSGLPGKVTVFLGAGASVPFDYPPTKPFVDELEKTIPMGDHLGNLLRKIRHLPEVEDAEHIIEILDSIEEIKRSRARRLFKDVKVTIDTVLTNGTYEQFESFALALQEQIKEAIFVTYRWRKEASAKLQLYDHLFSKLGTRVLDVFTTNYDRVIEEYSSSSKLDFYDGFRLNSKRRIWEWYPDIMDDSVLDPEKASLRLYKLHGSLNWWKNDEGKIEQVRPEARTSVAGDSYTENVLVYPGGKTQPSSQPFEWLYQAFHKKMETTSSCLVIGFSFRDEYLNQSFLHFLERNKTRLISVSPHATDNLEKNLFKKSLQNMQKAGQIIPIDKSFENETLKEIIPYFK